MIQEQNFKLPSLDRKIPTVYYARLAENLVESLIASLGGSRELSETPDNPPMAELVKQNRLTLCVRHSYGGGAPL